MWLGMNTPTTPRGAHIVWNRATRDARAAHQIAADFKGCGPMSDARLAEHVALVAQAECPDETAHGVYAACHARGLIKC